MTYAVGDTVRVSVGAYVGCYGEVVDVNMRGLLPNRVKVEDPVDPGLLWYDDHELEPATKGPSGDAVHRPGHYTWLPNGVEVIDLTEHLPFNRGNAVKYLARAGRKGSGAEVEDLKKAVWYIQREIARVQASAPNSAEGVGF
ncbi:DUF3310 domain-containing protein [Streptomyces sp. NPDC001941]|uniref:DUF3310 domain-containing protein n=1 Tax=Streptomyces sp. NPDC001941 TaxID=3154659 RepID=UPI00332D67F0